MLYAVKRRIIDPHCPTIMSFIKEPALADRCVIRKVASRRVVHEWQIRFRTIANKVGEAVERLVLLQGRLLISVVHGIEVRSRSEALLLPPTEIVLHTIK